MYYRFYLLCALDSLLLGFFSLLVKLGILSTLLVIYSKVMES